MSPSTIASDSLDLQVFQSMVGSVALLLPDAPLFTIVAVTDGYIQTSGRTREALIGKGLFDAFPGQAGDADLSSETGLRSSLEQVLLTKKSHKLPFHRYDITKPDGSFDERYWSAVNKPVINSEGAVLYIIHSVEDITEQVKTAQREAAFRSMEKVFGHLMLAPFVVGLAMGKNHVLEMANDAAFRLWGKGPEIIGKPLLESIPELEGQGILAIFDQVKSTGKPYFAREVPIFSMADGKMQTYYFDLIYQPFYEDGNEHATGVFTISHDVTEQVIARKQIEESEQRFRALVMASSDVVYNMSADWQELRALHGRGFLSDASEPVCNWLEQYVHPNDRDRVTEVIAKAIASKSVFELEHQVLRQDGSTGWVFSRAIPILDDNGAIAEWFGTASDITQRWQMDETLRATIAEAERQKRLYETITANTPDLIYVFDLNYRFTYANEALLAMWGKTREEAIGKGLLENGYEPWHAAMHHREIDQVVATKKPIRGEVSFPHATLGRRLYDYIFVPVINANGQVEAIAGTTRDITEIKKAEEVLRQSSEKLEAIVAERTRELQRSNTELEDFAYAASHDLKEPIRKIHFFSERLRSQLQDKLTGDQAMFFDRLEHASRRMESLIDDLLAYSHATRGADEQEEVDLNKKLRLVLEDLELEVQQRGAQIISDALPVIRGSKRQLQQLFYNLLTNALKYSKPGMQPEVHIRCRKVTGKDVKPDLPAAHAGKLFYLIEVQDNGIGFAQEDAQRIFNVFTRLHGNAEFKGTGVGLSIVRKVAENHGGYIWAESQPDNGATFKLLLPAG